VADLRDLEAIAALAAGHDAVLHAGFAGHGTDWFEAVAIEHALVARLVAALAGTNKTLVVSNGSLFLGDSGSARLDETAPVPPDHPAAVWARATGQATAANGVRGIELRLASFVYGHGDRGSGRAGHRGRLPGRRRQPGGGRSPPRSVHGHVPRNHNRLDFRRARPELGWSAAGHPPLLWDVAFGSYAQTPAKTA
jgi:hypothetical protein